MLGHTGAAFEQLLHKGVHTALEERAKLITQSDRQEDALSLFIHFLKSHFSLLDFFPSVLSILLNFICYFVTLCYTVTISFTHTVHTSSFSLSICLMGMFYWCSSYELSWAGDVNYKTMIGPLLHYAWKRPTGKKTSYSQQRWMDGGMNNGWKDGGAKHYCNMCLTKLKNCPGSHL